MAFQLSQSNQQCILGDKRSKTLLPNPFPDSFYTGSQTQDPVVGYHIEDVKVDGVSVGAVVSYTFTNVVAVHTIAVQFAINQYTITATADANGAISPSGAISVTYGSSQTFSFSPNAGYHIAAIIINGTTVATGSSFSSVTVPLLIGLESPQSQVAV
jgi:hypothetical protein